MAEQVQNIRDLTQTEKAAVLLLCMDEDSTRELFDNMDDTEIRKIGAALLKIEHIPAQHIQSVIDEFSKEVVGVKVAMNSGQIEDIDVDGREVTERLLNRTLGEQRGVELMHAIQGPALPPQTKGNGVDLAPIIGAIETDDLLEFITGEHPQVIAIVLSHAKRKVSRDVLAQLPEDIQIDVLGCMGGLESAPGPMMKQLADYLTQKMQTLAAAMASGDGGKKEEVLEIDIEGLDSTLRMLKSMSRDQSDLLIAQLAEIDPELAKIIEKRMFTIEDLERSDVNGIRELLRGVSNDDLKVALKDAPDSLKEMVFGNMSERAAMILREDMEVLPPLKVEEIEIAQENVLQVAKQLIKEEKMVLSEAADDE